MSLILCILPVQAQNEDYRKSFEEFRSGIHKDFQSFRAKVNQDYADFLRQIWRQFDKEVPVPKPREEEVPPITFPKDEIVPRPTPTPRPFDEIIPVPAPSPQPEPITPIKDESSPEWDAQQSFCFFGTTAKVRADRSRLVRLSGLDEDAVANAWSEWSDTSHDKIIKDCLNLRTKHSLCDWAYLMMIKEMATALYGGWCNDAVVLAAYVFCQSGYRVRLAASESALYLLYASEHMIYDIPSFSLSGTRFYPLGEAPSRLRICEVAFPKERPLSLLITHEQKFEVSETAQQERLSGKYPELQLSYTSNNNLLDFYSTYPTSSIGSNVCTRWAMYANTPMSAAIRHQIYPKLEAAIRGKSEIDGVNLLLGWIQTAFEYEYDDKVWGGDRAFFAEESLFYPYCDCEDRAILLTRLVRDLMGLPCILVYYPGHLAMAVHFTDGTHGDYINLGDKSFTIADPTFIGAPVGMTMPGMDNSVAKVILLQDI